MVSYILILYARTSIKYLCSCVVYSEWRYYRDNSGNCVWNDDYGLQSECLTGYISVFSMLACTCIMHVRTLNVCATEAI